MKHRYLLLVAVMLLWASPALAKLTFGVVEGGAVAEPQLRALGDYLQQGLREPVETRSFKDEKTLHGWLQQFRMVDLAILGRDYVGRQPAGEFFVLAELQGADGAPALVVMRQGTGAAQRAAIQKLLLGLAGDARLATFGASRIGPPGAQAAAAAPAPARPGAAASRPAPPSPAPGAAATSLRVGVLGAAAKPAAPPAVPVSAPAPAPTPAPEPVIARRPEPPLPVVAPSSVAPAAPAAVAQAPAALAAPTPAQAPVPAQAPAPAPPAPVVPAPQPPVAVAPAPAPVIAQAPAPAPVVAPAPTPAPAPAPQVARLEPPKPVAPPVAKPAPAPAAKPQPKPAPARPAGLPGARIVYIAPFNTVMVPGAFSEAAFDHFVDTLTSSGEQQGLEFIILKGGVERVDQAWLAANSYLTGEIFGYVEDKGASSTDIRTRSRVKLFPHGSDEPAIDFESPAKVFFDHDYSTLEKERRKLAEQMADDLATRVLASLTGG
ncbi:hypothetical protein DESUT3_37880 [Desulfuromonas versatilis]|uniref:Uncharacterized protein n=1 Tax=Desulfuromonas versatilis TaxID=2802975 RepID=A0ABM8HUX0_9BACT|nr:hypothetical protein [Desulfuromonas versatilis]BCR06719.1 hypothetical protein DESUT3_37880 [Desulfuromonas versatilis]